MLGVNLRSAAISRAGGGITGPVNDWVLFSGSWNDTGFWRDLASWP